MRPLLVLAALISSVTVSTRAAAEPLRFGVGGGGVFTVVRPAIGPELELGIAQTSWWAGVFMRGALSGNPIDNRGSFAAYGSIGGGFRSFWGDWGNGVAPVLGLGFAASAMHVFEGRTQEDTGCVGRCASSDTSGFGPYVELGVLFSKQKALRMQLTMRLDIPLTAWEAPAIPLTLAFRVSPLRGRVGSLALAIGRGAPCSARGRRRNMATDRGPVVSRSCRSPWRRVAGRQFRNARDGPSIQEQHCAA